MDEIELKLKLRPGRVEDFQATRNGETHYLYGKLYFILVPEKRVSPCVFRDTPLNKKHFTQCWNEGIVYVIANGNEVGILETS